VRKHGKETCGCRQSDISVGDVELLRQVLWSVESNYIGADVTEPERERGGLLNLEYSTTANA
jgi:hypothetical protein